MRMAGFSLGNLGQINATMQSLSSIHTKNAMLNPKPAVNPAESSVKKAKKKKGGKGQDGKSAGKKLKKAAQQLFEEEPGSTGSSPKIREARILQENEQDHVSRKKTGRQAVSSDTVCLDSFKVTDARELQKAVLWAEILGEPVSRKRRRERMERYKGKQYGNQSNADRR